MDRSEIDSLKEDLRRMQARIEELEATGEEPVNRRNMLRGLGAAAAGAAVGGLAFARPAAATDGDTLIIGNQTQTSTSPTMLVTSSGWSYESSKFLPGFCVSDDASLSNLNAAFSCIGAYADGSGPGADHTIALWGASTTGIGAKLDGPVPLKLTDASNSAVDQSSGTAGQFRVSSDETDLWYCVASSGSKRWRKLAGSASAGAFHAITPVRVYDSRAANPVGNVGILNSGSNRTISVADSRDASGNVIQTNTIPSGAIAVTANVTVTGTTGIGGYLSINPGGNTAEATSAINWFGAGQNIANGLTLTLNTSRQLTVVCGSGTGSNTHFIVDISGYYL